MKKLKLILVVVCTTLMSLTASATVTITAPEHPAIMEEELQGGNSYYLFNIGSGYFMNRNTDDPTQTGWSTEPFAFRLDDSSDGYYAFWSGEGYIGNWYSNIEWNYTTDNTQYYARFEPIRNDDLSYKIRHVDQNRFIGYNPNNTYVYSGVDEEYQDWAIIPAGTDESEAGLRYVCKQKLYDAIVAADEKGYPIKKYEDIYNNANSSNAELLNAAKELNNTESLTNEYSFVFAEWSDYTIAITDIQSWRRYYSSDNFLRTERWTSQDGDRNTIKLSVDIDQPSTLAFTMNSSARWANAPTMPIQVFIDGELAYDYKGETERYYTDSYFSLDNSDYAPYGQYYYYESNSYEYNRHFVDIEQGQHIIEIVATQAYNGNGNSSFNMYLSEIGIEKTPTIEVNLAKAGSLGDEVLRAMDNHPLISETNIRNVRKLKISGKMGDADFDEIYNMTSIFALDLTDADLTEIKDGQLSRYYHNDSFQFLCDVKLPSKLQTIGQKALFGTYIQDTDIPETVTTIGDFAFSNTRLKKANIPNVTTLGHNAFRGCTCLEEVVAQNLETIGINTFAECYNIKNITFDGTFTKIPQRTFYFCSNLELDKLPEAITVIENRAFDNNYNISFSLPEALTTVEEYAFSCAYNLKGDIPAGVTTIGNNAFQYAWSASVQNDIHLPENATFGSSAFLGSSVHNVFVPQEYYNLNVGSMFANCASLQSIKFMSPTMVSVPSDFVDGLTKKDIKVIVPEYLRTTYMRDSYWMDFTFDTFPTTEMTSIVLRQDLALSQHDRFEGTPDLAIEQGVTFEIEGAAGMDLKSVTLSSDVEANNYAQIWSGTDQISITETTSERLYTKGNKWYFLSLPFDCNLASTVNENGAKYAIRYYDGAARANGTGVIYPESPHDYYNYMTEESNKQKFSYSGAQQLVVKFNASTKTYNNYDVLHITGANGQNWEYYDNIGAIEVTIEGDYFCIWITSNDWGTSYGYSIDEIYADGVLLPKSENGANWKNYNVATDIIPAGTGFIFMTSQDSWTTFVSVDNATKNRVFESSDNENNEFHLELQKNPSENSANRGWNLVGNPYPNYYNNHKISFAAPITLWDGTTYKAYSLRDDDIAINPNQAIFVQCPDEIAEISFPAAGRQLTSEITDQANARPMMTTANSRQIVDLTLANDKYADDTRVVINKEASLSYEVGSDAGKFMSMDANVQQIFSLDAKANRYSINERPIDNGNVKLGVYFPTAGTYTISLKRNQAERVLLTDNVAGFTHDLTADDYTFTAESGSFDNRFVLTIKAMEVDGIENVEANETAEDSNIIYTIDGRRTDNMQKHGAYIMRNGKKVVK